MSLDTLARRAAADALEAVDQMRRSAAGGAARAGSIEGLLAFEERRRRIQRAVVVAVAVAIAAIGFAGLIRAFGSERTPADDRSVGAIAPTDLDRLELEWVGQAGPPGAVTLSAVGDAVLVDVAGTSDQPSHIAVFDVDCGSSGGRCEPARLLPAADRVVSVVPDGDTVAIVTDASVVAYPIGCLLEEGTCSPSWSVRGPPIDWDNEWVPPFWEEPVVAIRDGVLLQTRGSRLVAYVEGEGPVLIAELPLRYERLYDHFYDVRGTDVRITGPSQPILAGDSVVVAADRVYAFPIACPFDAGTPCEPMWMSPEPRSMGYWGRHLYTGPLAVRDGVVFATSLYSGRNTFAVGCRRDGGVCEPLEGSVGPDPTDPIAVSKDIVYEAAGATLTARSLSCDADGCTLAAGTPLWVGVLWDGPPGAPPEGPTEPLASGGSVFVAPLGGRHVFAFDGRCGVGGERCDPDWTYVTSGSIRTAPVVAGGRLFVGLGNGQVLAFAPTSADPSIGPFPVWTLAAAAGAAAAGLVAYRSLRRRAPRTPVGASINEGGRPS